VTIADLPFNMAFSSKPLTFEQINAANVHGTSIAIVQRTLAIREEVKIVV